jgi:hypothetical protein
MVFNGKYSIDDAYVPAENLKKAKFEKAALRRVGNYKDARRVRTVDSAWDRALLIARVAYKLKVEHCAGATHYHTKAVHPNWDDVVPVCTIGDHIFYKSIEIKTSRGRSIEKENIALGNKYSNLVAMIDRIIINNSTMTLDYPINNNDSPAVLLSQQSTSIRRTATGSSLVLASAKRVEEETSITEEHEMFVDFGFGGVRLSFAS